MNIKKKLTTLSLSTLALGAIAFTNVEEADAATWTPRTVEEVREDVNNIGQNEVEYTIQWGDTLGVIAKAVDLPLQTLVEINSINNADLIVVGNKIHFSNDKETVTIEDNVKREEKTYDVSEEQIEEVATEPLAAEPQAEPEVVEAHVPAQPVQEENEEVAEEPVAPEPIEESVQVEEEVTEEPVQEELAPETDYEEEIESYVAPMPAQEEPVEEAPVSDETPVEDAEPEPAPEPASENNQPAPEVQSTQNAPVQTASATSGGTDEPVATTAQASTGTSRAGGSVVGIANQYLGTPYLWAGTTPAGFDCSGFTQFVFAKAGVSIPRNTNSQYAAATPVSNPQPGDLVFFGSAGNVQHVGIYAGGGQFVGSQSSTGVAYADVFGPYWGQRFLGYGRI